MPGINLACVEQPYHYKKTAIPRIIFNLGLPSRAIALYLYYTRKTADEHQCCDSISKIKKELYMSTNTLLKCRAELAEPRQELAGKPLIVVTQRTKESGMHDTTLVKIVDIWKENDEFYKT